MFFLISVRTAERLVSKHMSYGRARHAYRDIVTAALPAKRTFATQSYNDFLNGCFITGDTMLDNPFTPSEIASGPGEELASVVVARGGTS
jgi:hypothetical protein